MVRIAPLVVLVGCSSGSVVLPSELGEFGTVKDSAWVVTTSIDGGSVYIDHTLVLSNESGLCGRLQRVYDDVVPVTSSMYGGYYQYYGEPDYYEKVCNWYKTLLGAYGEATQPLMHDGAHILSLSVSSPQGEYDWSNEPAAGTYERCDYSYGWDSGDSDCDRRFYGWVSLYTGNPYEDAANALQCAGADSEEDFYDDFYPAIEAQQPISMDGGTLTLTASGDDRWKGVLSGVDLGDASGLSAEATFPRCDVLVRGEGYIPGLY